MTVKGGLLGFGCGLLTWLGVPQASEALEASDCLPSAAPVLICSTHYLPRMAHSTTVVQTTSVSHNTLSSQRGQIQTES